MNVTSRTEKVDEKIRSFELWSVICPRKCIFCNFVLISARNLSLLKVFTYMRLKVLITLFQKMIWFIGFSAIFHEILAIKISKKMLTKQKFNKIFRLRSPNISTTVSHIITINTNFKVCNEIFQMHVCKFL